MTTSMQPTARPRRAHIFAPDPHGFYVEPQWFSVRLFEVEQFGAPGTRILDPAGDGFSRPHKPPVMLSRAPTLLRV